MKAILEFDLPNDEGDYKLAVNARSLYCALWDMDQFLRNKIKYDDKLSEEQLTVYESTREQLHTILSDNNIKL